MRVEQYDFCIKNNFPNFKIYFESINLLHKLLNCVHLHFHSYVITYNDILLTAEFFFYKRKLGHTMLLFSLSKGVKLVYVYI